MSGSEKHLKMNWLWAFGFGFVVLLIAALLFALATKILRSYSARRGSAATTVARVRFLMALVLLSSPAYVFLKLSPSFQGKNAGYLAAEVVVIMAASLIFLESFSELFIRRFLSVKLGAEIPPIMLDFTKVVLYIVVILVILHDFYSFDITPFLATSAIVTVILGFALQDTLGNAVAGLALHFSSPYRVGDWIQVGNLEGKILRIEWRSTLILTRSNDAIVIPHVTMAKNEIYNFSAPSAKHARELKIPINYGYPPDQVIRSLVEAAEGADGILSDPKPQVYLLDFQKDLALYGVWVWIEDFEHLPEILGGLLRRIWYALQRGGFTLRLEELRGITLVPPSQDDSCERNKAFLLSLPLFQELDEESLRYLSKKVKLLVYGDGEKMIKEGDEGRDLFVLYGGKAAALKNGAPFHEFKPGDFFGEMALLTGEPRKATIAAVGEAQAILFERELLAPFLETHPAFLQKLSDAIVERLKTLPAEEIFAAKTEQEMQNETFGDYILRRIKSFFLSQ